MVKQSLRSPVGDQVGVEKLIIETRIDLDGKDTETNKGNTVKT